MRKAFRKLLLLYIILGGISGIHELGHYVAFQQNSISVERVVIGSGPVIHGVRLGNTKFLFKLIPLNGSNRTEAWSACSFRQKTAICFSGIAVVLLLGICALLIRKWKKNPELYFMSYASFAYSAAGLAPVSGNDGYSGSDGYLWLKACENQFNLSLSWNAIEIGGVIMLLLAIVSFGSAALYYLIQPN